ncbi:glycosyl hydrolase family 1, partial [Escherichia coli]|nr:glycosyl hydrolase family 1 [Escherichia coli]
MVKKLVGLAKNNHPEKRCIADTEIYNVRNFKKNNYYYYYGYLLRLLKKDCLGTFKFRP